MADNSDFFQAIQGAAVVKHKLLGTYVSGFIGKTSSISRGRVAYLDGSAGPGVYPSRLTCGRISTTTGWTSGSTPLPTISTRTPSGARTLACAAGVNG